MIETNQCANFVSASITCNPQLRATPAIEIIMQNLQLKARVCYKFCLGLVGESFRKTMLAAISQNLILVHLALLKIDIVNI